MTVTRGENKFNYYALHYLNQWTSQEKACCEALSGSSDSEKLAALRRAGGFFRIARNLRKCHDEGKGLPRYGPVLEIIDALNPADFQGDRLLPEIKKVGDKISAQYGGRGTLSATTKFLWLKLKSPVIVYDRQARTALGVPEDKIDDYYTKWREGFSNCEQQIRNACGLLPDVFEYADPDIATPEQIAEIAGQVWFRERVFDAYLWRQGLEFPEPDQLEGSFSC